MANSIIPGVRNPKSSGAGFARGLTSFGQSIGQGISQYYARMDQQRKQSAKRVFDIMEELNIKDIADAKNSEWLIAQLEGLEKYIDHIAIYDEKTGKEKRRVHRYAWSNSDVNNIRLKANKINSGIAVRKQWEAQVASDQKEFMSKPGLYDSSVYYETMAEVPENGGYISRQSALEEAAKSPEVVIAAKNAELYKGRKPETHVYDKGGKRYTTYDYGASIEEQQGIFEDTWERKLDFRKGLRDDFVYLPSQEIDMRMRAEIMSDPVKYNQNYTGKSYAQGVELAKSAEDPRHKMSAIAETYGQRNPDGSPNLRAAWEAVHAWGRDTKSEKFLANRESSKPLPKSERPKVKELIEIPKQNNVWSMSHKPKVLSESRLTYWDEDGEHVDQPLNNFKITQVVDEKNPYDRDAQKSGRYAIALVSTDRSFNDYLNDEENKLRLAGASEKAIDDRKKDILYNLEQGTLKGVGKEFKNIWIPYDEVAHALGDYNFEGIKQPAKMDIPRIKSDIKAADILKGKKEKVGEEKTDEVERKTKDGKIAIFNAATKEFIRWK